MYILFLLSLNFKIKFIQIDKYLVKEFEGDLVSFNEEEYVIETMIKTRKVTVNVKRQLVAKIRLAIKF